MQPNENSSPGDEGFSLLGHPDPFTAGDSVLDRAKTISQQIADRVRELTQDTPGSGSDGQTDDGPPLTD